MDLWLEFDASSLAGSQPLTAPKTVPGLRSLGPFVGEDGHLRRQIMAAYDAEIRGEKMGTFIDIKITWLVVSNMTFGGYRDNNGIILSIYYLVGALEPWKFNFPYMGCHPSH